MHFLYGKVYICKLIMLSTYIRVEVLAENLEAKTRNWNLKQNIAGINVHIASSFYLYG